VPLEALARSFLTPDTFDRPEGAEGREHSPTANIIGFSGLATGLVAGRARDDTIAPRREAARVAVASSGRVQAEVDDDEITSSP